MAVGSVKIGPEFFAKAFNDYSDWKWALAREFMQNSIDANSENINITIRPERSDSGKINTRCTIQNDGSPMTHDILTNKFLALGGSGKGFQGTVGGFGKAKELLAFCHLQYTIRTGDLTVTGCGADYDLNHTTEYLHGTTSSILIAGDHISLLKCHFANFARWSQWHGTITINATTSDDGTSPDVELKIPERTKKGSRRKDLEWGIIYTNKSANGLLLVRINGTPMFTKRIDYKGMVLIELAGTSANVLTSNRDGLRSPYDDELDDFLVSISTNSRKALKDTRNTERKVYDGYKLAAKLATKADETSAAKKRCAAALEKFIGQFGNGDSDGDFDPADVTQDMVLVARIVNNTQKSATADAPPITMAQVREVLRPEFHILSEIGGTIPGWFLPETFSDNSKRLISNWMAILVELALLTEQQKPFAVGFVFDPDVEALYSDENGPVIYISPAEIVQKEGKPRQLKVRWKFDAAGNWQLLAIAIHEFVHFLGYGSHDEAYARKITDMFGLVLANRTRFSRHFSAPICWPS